ncbi:HAD-IA family hydrolase [Paenibacillus sp. MAH-36]|uniref:HAD-IA family hydrolase n=1 Tax=Paenibacillus violae TaxID=3077234 RepID=A0ABU3R862_9BACL|nr:HAD-IA family hydrolase [Paenibacillus sp. PFR10]MDU0200268.1 HAD-IA family hydrolase [Paenibacillus sp. PFR10]
MDISKIKIIMFDTFGTVMDWHGAIVDTGICLGNKYGFSIDWNSFANSWRVESYINAVDEIVKGLRPWETNDVINKRKLLELIERYRISFMSTEDVEKLNLIWHRLRPWCDSLPGLLQLSKKYRLGPFSNGDFRLLLDMEKYWNLPWDFIISGQMFKKFKPDPTIYVDAVNLLGGNPQEILMVAAHPTDLDGAANAGISTVYIPRPIEFGKHSGYVEPPGNTKPDMIVSDLVCLANILGTC